MEAHFIQDGPSKSKKRKRPPSGTNTKERRRQRLAFIFQNIVASRQPGVPLTSLIRNLSKELKSNAVVDQNTIVNDLTRLSEQKDVKLKLSRGGGRFVYVDSLLTGATFARNEVLNKLQKERLAAFVAKECVQENERLLLGSGTQMVELARALTVQSGKLSILTPSIAALPILALNRSIAVFMCGEELIVDLGVLRSVDNQIARAQIAGFTPQKIILSAKSIDLEGEKLCLGDSTTNEFYRSIQWWLSEHPYTEVLIVCNNQKLCRKGQKLTQGRWEEFLSWENYRIVVDSVKGVSTMILAKMGNRLIDAHRSNLLD